MLNTAYIILGLTKGASPSEVKETYKKLILKFHPDKNPENFLALEKFKLIQRSFEMALADAKRRIERYSDLPKHSKTNNLPRICRRRKRGCRTDRKFNWQLKGEYIGTHIHVKT